MKHARPIPLRPRAGALLLGAALVALAGCGDDEEGFTDRSKAFGTAPGATSAPSIGPSSDSKAGKAVAAELAKVAAVPMKVGAGGKKSKIAARVYTE
jgi:hypothetical protein